MSSISRRIKALARRLGFDLVGVAQARRSERGPFFRHWLAQGFAAGMGYLAQAPERRCDPRLVFPGAQSVLCVGSAYSSGAKETVYPGRGRISRYARGKDYHQGLKTRLLDLLAAIQALEPSAQGRVYVDTGPVLERDAAAQAGLGWVGKNTCLIQKDLGSWFFLGEIILNISLEPDGPVSDHCGGCTRCMDACPTRALTAPYTLDAGRCISYLTIELKGPVPRELRPLMGDWVFGCDICQEVCPWNKKAKDPRPHVSFGNGSTTPALDLADVLAMDQATFSHTFKGSPIKRAKRRGLLRNALVALGNTGGAAHIPVLARALGDEESLVRGHAAWALGRIGGAHARTVLEQSLVGEGDPDVREEIALALG